LNKKRICLFSLFIVLWLMVNLHAQTSEYELKAVYLERFTRFVDWSEESSMSDTTKPFVIGVIGENPFGKCLERIYEKRKIKNKAVEILLVKNLNDISKCHILFIPKSEKRHLDKIINITRNRPILTIADTKGFCEKNVHINFYFDADRVRFEINNEAVKKAGLYMKYQLLERSKIIKCGEDE